LHRCLQRHGISRLPDVEDGKVKKRKFKAYPIGYFHVDIAEVRTQEGRLYLFVAIDRTSKFAFPELHEKATTAVSREFLLHLIAAVPYKIHTVLTDNGPHFTDPSGTSWTAAEIKELIARKEPFRAHAFEYTCAKADIDHRLTKPKHPWTNGQVERMNRTIKDATVKRFHYETTISFEAISPTSSQPTTSPSASRPSKASRRTSTSASSGQRSRTASPSIRSSKCRD
jgi:transposase InsO family protein